MIHQHPLRKWTVEVLEAPEFQGDHFDVSWRDTTRLGSPCELFSIMSDRHPDDMFVQIMLFEDGSTHTCTWHPALIDVYPAKKHVKVGILKSEHCIPDRYAEQGGMSGSASK